MNPDNHTWDLLVGALKGTLGEAEQREFDRWAAEAENRRFYKQPKQPQKEDIGAACFKKIPVVLEKG